MGDVLSKGALFDPTLTKELFDKVKGKSSLATLCDQKPIPFNGSKEFVFTMDSEVDLVAENGAKSHGGISLDPIKIVPLKIEYGARISDEFMYASEDEQIDILRGFSDGFAKKAARGLDIMGFHGINPRSKATSSLIGTNHFDSGVTVIAQDSKTPKTPDALIEDAIDKVQENEYDISGLVMAPSFRSELSKMVDTSGRRIYPDLAWGNQPGVINGVPTTCNNTLSFNSSKDLAIVGDFANAFRWGYAKNIPLEVIQYGDPDNSGKDLKGYNQVYLRAEVYLGWGILDKTAFAVIQSAAT